MATKPKPDKKVDVTIVVSGQPERLEINHHQSVEHLVEKALKRSGNAGQAPGEIVAACRPQGVEIIDIGALHQLADTSPTTEEHVIEQLMSDGLLTRAKEKLRIAWAERQPRPRGAEAISVKDRPEEVEGTNE